MRPSAAAHRLDDGVPAGHPQVGFLLTREGRIREVLGGGRGTIISAITLAVMIPTVKPAFGSAFNLDPLVGSVFPLVLSGIGILASILGVLMVRGGENTNPAKALNIGTYVSALIVVVCSFVLSYKFFDNINPAVAIVAGLVVGVLIGKITEIYTSGDYRHIKKIARSRSEERRVGKECRSRWSPYH